MLIKSLLTLTLAAVLSTAITAAQAQWIHQTSFSSVEVPRILSYDSELFICANDAGLWKSSDAGQTASQVFANPHSYQIYSICFIGNIGLMSTDEGTYRSTNLGDSWVPVPGMSLTADALLAVDSILIGGSNTGVFRSTDSGISWQSISNADSVSTFCLTSINTVILAGSVEGWYSYRNTMDGIWRSTDLGANWTRSSLPDSIGVTSFAITGNIVFAGTVHGVFRSDDTGYTWEALNTGLANLNVWSLATDGSNLFAGTQGGVFYLRNDSTWQNVSQDLVDTANLKDTLADALAISNGYLVAGVITDNWDITDWGVWRRPLSDFGISSVSQMPTTKSGLRVYPNPLSQSATISFTPEISGYADVSILNLLGVEVAHLFSGEVGAGNHSFTWKPSSLPDGMYECLVRMNGQVETLPVVVAH